MLKPEDYRSVTGPQKAAILMLALGEEQCTRLFAMMHEDEIKEISSAMSRLGAVRAETVERLCVDFVENMGAAGNLVGSGKIGTITGKLMSAYGNLVLDTLHGIDEK